MLQPIENQGLSTLLYVNDKKVNNILLTIPLTDRPTGNRPLGRPRRRWKDNIRMDLEEIGINAGNWVDSAQDRDYWRALVNAALNLRVL